MTTKNGLYFFNNLLTDVYIIMYHATNSGFLLQKASGPKAFWTGFDYEIQVNIRKVKTTIFLDKNGSYFKELSNAIYISRQRPTVVPNFNPKLSSCVDVNVAGISLDSIASRPIDSDKSRPFPYHLTLNEEFSALSAMSQLKT